MKFQRFKCTLMCVRVIIIKKINKIYILLTLKFNIDTDIYTARARYFFWKFRRYVFNNKFNKYILSEEIFVYCNAKTAHRNTYKY